MLSLLISALATPAFAQDDDYDGLLASARKALVDGEYKTARDLLTSAESAAPGSDKQLSQAEVARLFFYRGVLYWRASPESSALENWRQTLAVSPRYQPEPDLLDASERDAFLALRAEVEALPPVKPNLPEDPEDMVLFIDGQQLDSEETIAPGTHFVQARCGADEFHGAWYTYGTPPSDYTRLCRDGILKGSKSTASSSSSSSSSHSSTSSHSSSSSHAEPKSEREEVSHLDDKEKPEKSGGGGEAGKNIAGITLLALGAGGAGVTVVFYDQANTSAQAYESKKDAAVLDPSLRASASDYYDHTVVPRYMRLYGTAIGSGVLLASGVVLIALDGEGPIAAPLPGGGMVGWTGRF